MFTRAMIAAALCLSASTTIRAEEWTKLDLSKCETEGNWKTQEDGSIYLKPRSGEKGWTRYGSYLWFPGKYSDFVCEFEYKHEAKGNSGFYFRVPDKDKPTTVGVEIQILDCHKKKNIGFHDLGGIIKFKDVKKGDPLVNAAKPAGEWNKVKTTVKGSVVTVEINGKVVQDKVDLKERELAGGLVDSGYIGIQDHGLPFWVRNIRIKKLTD